MKPTVLILAILLFLILPVTAETYSFAFVPQQSAKKLAKKWGPIIQYINQHTGDTYRFQTAKDIPSFEKRLLEQTYDVAYMNPYHFVVFNQKANYQALAKQKNKQIKGIIVVHKDSPISDLHQLTNLTLAFPAPAAFAASILPRAELRNRNIAFTSRYVSSHDSVYLNVARGFMHAGGGVMRTLNNADTVTRNSLKILWTTPGYTPHAFATKEGFPEEAAKRLLSAMLSMNDNDEGNELLKTVNFRGIEKAKNQDWDDIKALELNTLVGVAAD